MMSKKLTSEFNMYIFTNFMFFNLMIVLLIVLHIHDIFILILLFIGGIYLNWANIDTINKIKKELKKNE
jgi:threonine/homoserine/homoserine lactone efflux protein